MRRISRANSGYLKALEQLHSDPDRAARQHFDRLSRDEQIAAIRRMRVEGHGDYQIAAATRWSVESVRAVLGEGRQ